MIKPQVRFEFKNSYIFPKYKNCKSNGKNCNIIMIFLNNGSISTQIYRDVYRFIGFAEIGPKTQTHQKAYLLKLKFF